jgi:hypothetical protein
MIEIRLLSENRRAGTPVLNFTEEALRRSFRFWA